MTRLWLPWACLALLALGGATGPPGIAAGAWGADGGVIQGVVLDARGAGLPGAKVYAVRVGVAMGAALPEAITDSRGRFELRRLAWGEYRVVAAKVEDGYPNVFSLNSRLYGEPPAPSVKLRSGAAAARVTVRLGPRAGMLELRLLDRVSGAELPYVSFEMYRVDEPGVTLSSSQRSRVVLVPAGRAVRLTIQMPGYRPWSEVLQLASGARRRLTVKLAPLPARGVLPSTGRPTARAIAPTLAVAGIPLVEAFGSPSANSCGAGLPSATDTYTDSTGTFQRPDQLALCSTACSTGSCPAPNSCTLSIPQTWSANGILVRTNSIVYGCTYISVNGF